MLEKCVAEQVRVTVALTTVTAARIKSDLTRLKTMHSRTLLQLICVNCHKTVVTRETPSRMFKENVRKDETTRNDCCKLICYQGNGGAQLFAPPQKLYGFLKMGYF